MEPANSTKLNKILDSLKPVWLSVSVISFFINLLILPISLYSLQVMDRVVGTGSIATLLWLTIIMIIMFVAAGLLQTFRSMILHNVSEWIYNTISETALPLVLSQTATGGKGAQHLRDAGTLRQFVGGNALITLIDTPWSILYIITLFIIHWSLGLLVTAGAASLIFLAWLNETAISKLNKEAGVNNLRAMQELELATRNAEVTEAMGMGEALSSRWKKMQKITGELQTKSNGRSSVIQGVTKFLRLTLQILVTCVSAWIAVNGHITIGAIIASSILASRALAPFESAISSWKSFIDTKIAYDRLKKVFSDSEIENKMSLPRPEGRLSVEKVSFSVAEREEPILQDISFNLAAGETLGIVGASGSGKSTLARTLMGVWTVSSGVIRFDNADIKSWSRTDFGKFVGYLPQDVELFAGSVKDNISRFNENASPEAIIMAAQMANAHDLILRLPKGYESEVGQGGAVLSAGQRQRIGLARAFFNEPRFLVLDEPDANLDTDGLQALVSALHLAKQRKITTVIITHRNTLTPLFDKILIMHEGKMGAFGQTKETLAAYAAHFNPPTVNKV